MSKALKLTHKDIARLVDLADRDRSETYRMADERHRLEMDGIREKCERVGHLWRWYDVRQSNGMFCALCQEGHPDN